MQQEQIPQQPIQVRTHISPAVAQANKSSDYIVLAATFFVFFLLSSGYFIYSYFTSDDFTKHGFDPFGFIGTLFSGLVLFIALLLYGMFTTRMTRQTMLGNSLQIEYSDYAWLREWANKVAADLQLPRIEIFITQDPVMNAYSFGFIRPYNIVLQSGTVQWLDDDELRAVIVHEMGHIKYGHTIAGVYLQPYMALPVIGTFTSWLAGFWERRKELTADRLALMYLRDVDLVKRALAKVYIGPDGAQYLNQVAEQWLHFKADRPMNRFAQTFSDHPFLVRRLGHLESYRSVLNPTTIPQQPTESTPRATA